MRPSKHFESSQQFLCQVRSKRQNTQESSICTKLYHHFTKYQVSGNCQGYVCVSLTHKVQRKKVYFLYILYKKKKITGPLSDYGFKIWLNFFLMALSFWNSDRGHFSVICPLWWKYHCSMHFLPQHPEYQEQISQSYKLFSCLSHGIRNMLTV